MIDGPAKGRDDDTPLFPSADQAQLGGPFPVGSGRREMVKTLAGGAADAALRARSALRREGAALDRAAAATPVRDVLVAGIYTTDGKLAMDAALRELRDSRHDVRVSVGGLGDPGLEGGKFANLNRLLESAGEPAEWTVLLDDDIELPARFLDRAIGACERLGFALAQPAQTWRSDAAWRVTRRRADIARRTNFVEIGPVCVVRRDMLEAITPFYEEGMGWGLCLHWAAIARDRGWRLGILDALPVRNVTRPTASRYSPGDAKAEAARFLATHEHIDRATAGEELESFRVLPGQ